MDIKLNHKFISLKYVWLYLYINTLNNQEHKTHISLVPYSVTNIAYRTPQLWEILKPEKVVCVNTRVVVVILRLALCYCQ
jgi:hypothetical protein